MSKGWVLNASPIITLAKVGHLNLLVALAPDLCIPHGVHRKISPEKKIGKTAKTCPEFLSHQPVKPRCFRAADMA